MGTWNGGALLVRHMCGARLWLEDYQFYAFAIVGPTWWRGERVSVCQCGADISEFRSREWSEA